MVIHIRREMERVSGGGKEMQHMEAAHKQNIVSGRAQAHKQRASTAVSRTCEAININVDVLEDVGPDQREWEWEA